MISQRAVKPGRKRPLYLLFPPMNDRACCPKFFGVTSFCLGQSGLLIDRRKSILIWGSYQVPCPGLDKPCPKHPAWGIAHGGVRVTFQGVCVCVGGEQPSER